MKTRLKIILALYSFLPGMICAQTYVQVAGGAAYQPEHYYFNTAAIDSRFLEGFNFQPVLQAQLGFRHFFRRGPWFIEEMLFYRSSRMINQLDFRDETMNLFIKMQGLFMPCVLPAFNWALATAGGSKEVPKPSSSLWGSRARPIWVPV